MKRSLLFLLLCLYSCTVLYAQDIHFSQFWETAVLRNPALTGIHNSNLKAAAAYRSQWSAVAAPFVSTAISAEARFGIGRYSRDYCTISGMFYADKAGRAALKTTGFYPSLAYHKSLGDAANSYLTAGFTAGYVQRSYDLTRLTFDNQYQGGAFVASAGAGEGLPLQQLHYWDGGAGLSYNSSVGLSGFTTYYIGISVYHLSGPRGSFASDGQVVSLPLRWNGSLGVNVRTTGAWGVQIHGSFTREGAYTETIGGGLVRWAHGGDGREGGEDFALLAGAMVRVGDAVVPVLQIDWGKQRFGLSYDVNTSNLKVASRLRGGLEVTACFNGVLGRRGESGESPRF